jgi:hypothetical protein
MLQPRQLFILTLLLLLAQASTVLAQPGRGRRGGPPTIDRATALGVDQVRMELKLDDAQAATIDAALEAYRQERRDAQPDRSSFSFLTPEEQDDLRKKADEDSKQISKNTDETLGALLEPAQVKRLDQMILQAQLQLAPATALRDNLDLSEDQQSKLTDIEKQIADARDRMRSEMMQKFQAGERPDFSEVRKLMAKAQEDALTSVMAIVTDEQKATLTELQGEKFDIDLLSVMRGGERDRGRGRGRGPGGGGNRRRQTDSGDSE